MKIKIIKHSFTLIELLACPAKLRSRICGRERRRSSMSFTLIELLVVIAIVGILFGIGLPAFEKLAKGQGLTLAARNMSSTLKSTRAYAITKRKRTFLAFPTGGDFANSYFYASYRSGLVDSSDNFVNWFEGSKWNLLPTGIIFNSITNSGTVNNINTSGFATTATFDVIVFKPSGQLDFNSSINLQEGAYSGGSKVLTNPGSPGITIDINKFTGRISFD